jgi:hypothetical protein
MFNTLTFYFSAKLSNIIFTDRNYLRAVSTIHHQNSERNSFPIPWHDVTFRLPRSDSEQIYISLYSERKRISKLNRVCRLPLYEAAAEPKPAREVPLRFNCLSMTSWPSFLNHHLTRGEDYFLLYKQDTEGLLFCLSTKSGDIMAPRYFENLYLHRNLNPKYNFKFLSQAFNFTE